MAKNTESKTNGMTPNDLLGVVQELVSAQREIDEATGRKRAILKRAKGMGANLKALAAIQQMRKDPDEAALYIKDLARYSAWMKLPIFTQADIFSEAGPDDEATHKYDLQRAFDEGYHFGADKGDIEGSPYPAGNEFHVKWIEGYRAGEATLKGAEAEGVIKASTSRKRKPAEAAASDLH